MQAPEVLLRSAFKNLAIGRSGHSRAHARTRPQRFETARPVGEDVLDVARRSCGSVPALAQCRGCCALGNSLRTSISRSVRPPAVLVPAACRPADPGAAPTAQTVAATASSAAAESHHPARAEHARPAPEPGFLVWRPDSLQRRHDSAAMAEASSLSQRPLDGPAAYAAIARARNCRTPPRSGKARPHARGIVKWLRRNQDLDGSREQPRPLHRPPASASTGGSPRSRPSSDRERATSCQSRLRLMANSVPACSRFRLASLPRIRSTSPCSVSAIPAVSTCPPSHTGAAPGNSASASSYARAAA